jgi:hypothetical protein
LETFENIEIRRVTNGFVVAVNTEADSKEYVYDTSRKALRAVRMLLDPKSREEAE